MSILNRFQLRAWVLGCLVCGLWQSGATAAVITYTDQTAFNAAVTGQVTRNFAALNGYYPSPLDVSFSGYTISASANGIIPGLFVGNPGGLFSTNTADAFAANEPLTFTFTGTLPTAVGGLFFTTDVLSSTLLTVSLNAISSTLTVSLNDGTFINLPAPSALNLTGAFAGFTSDVGITSLVVGGPFSTSPAYATVTSLYVASGPSATVPEPSTALMSVVGLLGLVVYRKRMKT